MYMTVVSKKTTVRFVYILNENEKIEATTALDEIEIVARGQNKRKISCTQPYGLEPKIIVCHAVNINYKQL